MTVSSTTNKVIYTATAGQTVFPYTFRIFQATDLQVVSVSTTNVVTLLANVTDYAVTGMLDYAGGNVTLTNGALVGTNIVIFRNPANVQDTQLVEGGAYSAATLMNMVDLLTMQVQAINSIQGNQPCISLNDSITTAQMPTPIPIGGVPTIDSTGTKWVWGIGAISDAPFDGQYYSRRNGGWTISPAGLTDAPSDGTTYGRKNATWTAVTNGIGNVGKVGTAFKPGPFTITDTGTIIDTYSSGEGDAYMTAAINPTTGLFTAPVTGNYLVSINALIGASAGMGEYMKGVIFIQKNGTSTTYIGSIVDYGVAGGATTYEMALSASGIIVLTAGETLGALISTNGTTTPTAADVRFSVMLAKG